MTRQSEAAECGLACLAMVAGYHGLHTDLTTLRRRFPLSMNGATLADLAATGQALDLTSRAVRCDIEDFKHLRLPCILHWEFKHFVVLAKVTANHALIFDPAVGERRIAWKDITRSFTGVALELTPGQQFSKRTERSQIGLFNLIPFTPDVVKALAQGLLLSLLLEIFVVLTPFYMQLVVDEAILSVRPEGLRVI